MESQKMRTQICVTVKRWLLKIRAESSVGWWVRVEDWMDLLEFGGGLGDACGGTEAQTTSARTVGEKKKKKYSIFI